ncbi:hypothetical protein B0H67DRAFT_220456 [Lasiosphaeris hirsuta]|uniref:Uncharacterized protein n=1 Tax=Lasiosphaeris hirsuta TaxID=260670 RepID=A0AA40DTA3_9PEZI|nr:hypothetical protein B0H67DRAFT_220456 [Lasiosphaeris hirsuta]
MDGETSRDWDLIAVAENLLDHVCHSRKTRSATLATRRHGRPFAVYYKIDPHILSGADISDHVYYSRTAYPWYEPVVAPTQLSLWIATFVLCAAVQPTGRILGRDFEAPWVMRCFPIMYAADAVACLGSWARLAVFSGQGVVGAATQVLRDRNTGSESDEWPLALEKMKAAAPARWAVFVAGVLPCFLKLCVAGGLFHAQVLGCMYVGGWLIFEALVLAAATDATETSDDEPDASTSEDSADATPPRWPMACGWMGTAMRAPCRSG